MCILSVLAIKMMDLVRSPGLVVLLTFGVCLQGLVCISKAKEETKDSNGKKLLPQCGNQTFNPEHSTCTTNGQANLTDLLSQEVSECCGLQSYNPLNEICCQSTVLIRPTARAKCCGGEAIDEDSQLCCGKIDTKVILTRTSPDHMCCGRSQYNINTENCSDENGSLRVKPKEYLYCGPNGSKVMLSRKSADHRCCGQDQYNFHTECCCEKNNTLSVTSRSECKASCPVLNESTQNITDTSNTDDKGPHHHRGVHQTESKQQNKCHPENQCCGNQVFNASTHICCNGNSYIKGENIKCCGTEAYDVNNPNLKCCMGSLHNLTSNPAVCCGSRLRKKEETCCSSESRQLLYSAKKGLQCCGHLYYNTSLWFKGKTNGSPLLCTMTQEEQKLCNKGKLEKVESVSVSSTVSRNVLKVYSKGGLVYFEARSVMISKDPGKCTLPQLTTGKVYFFSGTNVFVKLAHKSVFGALYFIVSTCQQ